MDIKSCIDLSFKYKYCKRGKTGLLFMLQDNAEVRKVSNLSSESVPFLNLHCKVSKKFY